MTRLITWLLGAMAAAMILLLWVVAAWTPPRGVYHPSKLEKTCQISKPGTHPVFDPPRFATVPCKALDEYLQSTWEI